MFDVRDAGHWGESGHVRYSAKIVEYVHGEGTVLTVEGDELEPDPTGEFYEGGGGEGEVEAVGHIALGHVGYDIVHSHGVGHCGTPSSGYHSVLQGLWEWSVEVGIGRVNKSYSISYRWGFR